MAFDSNYKVASVVISSFCAGASLRPFPVLTQFAGNEQKQKRNKKKQNKLIPPTGDPSEEADALDWLISRQSKFFLQLYKSQFHPRASPFDEK